MLILNEELIDELILDKFSMHYHSHLILRSSIEKIYKKVSYYCKNNTVNYVIKLENIKCDTQIMPEIYVQIEKDLKRSSIINSISAVFMKTVQQVNHSWHFPHANGSHLCLGYNYINEYVTEMSCANNLKEINTDKILFVLYSLPSYFSTYNNKGPYGHYTEGLKISKETILCEDVNYTLVDINKIKEQAYISYAKGVRDFSSLSNKYIKLKGLEGYYTEKNTGFEKISQADLYYDGEFILPYVTDFSYKEQKNTSYKIEYVQIPELLELQEEFLIKQFKPYLWKIEIQKFLTQLQ